mmetsp:Transcript_17537/g.22157  ORF Transcript_17537/g.22157 Transcript_17537/m.22157 type:complete len:250 (-) Transcript_17537:518-1267(-)
MVVIVFNSIANTPNVKFLIPRGWAMDFAMEAPTTPRIVDSMTVTVKSSTRSTPIVMPSFRLKSVMVDVKANTTQLFVVLMVRIVQRSQRLILIAGPTTYLLLEMVFVIIISHTILVNVGMMASIVTVSMSCTQHVMLNTIQSLGMGIVIIMNLTIHKTVLLMEATVLNLTKNILAVQRGILMSSVMDIAMASTIHYRVTMTAATVMSSTSSIPGVPCLIRLPLVMANVINLRFIITSNVGLMVVIVFCT